MVAEAVEPETAVLVAAVLEPEAVLVPVPAAVLVAVVLEAVVPVREALVELALAERLPSEEQGRLARPELPERASHPSAGSRRVWAPALDRDPEWDPAMEPRAEPQATARISVHPRRTPCRRLPGSIPCAGSISGARCIKARPIA